MIRQKNLRSFHNFFDFPVSWILETEPTKLANGKGYTENEKSQQSERHNRKMQLGMEHRRVREIGLPVHSR